MTRQQLHDWLVATAGLVPEPAVNSVSRTYFYKTVEWHPARSSRVLRVLFGADGQPNRIQLCASSDNNNAVLIAGPFTVQGLGARVAQEVERVRERLGACSGG
ncbi:hypothetical protein [Acidovorax sp. Leaf78]|uniref:hypothetical protein n=1 Tax=Acidovorax sp. Leaf78 TaxID=1736237 RepID=UPI000B2C598D|nr:hypothetical protein [Acidovorax sp. Leaf78]